MMKLECSSKDDFVLREITKKMLPTITSIERELKSISKTPSVVANISDNLFAAGILPPGLRKTVQ